MGWVRGGGRLSEHDHLLFSLIFRQFWPGGRRIFNNLNLLDTMTGLLSNAPIRNPRWTQTVLTVWASNTVLCCLILTAVSRYAKFPKRNIFAIDYVSDNLFWNFQHALVATIKHNLRLRLPESHIRILIFGDTSTMSWCNHYLFFNSWISIFHHRIAKLVTRSDMPILGV